MDLFTIPQDTASKVAKIFDQLMHFLESSKCTHAQNL